MAPRMDTAAAPALIGTAHLIQQALTPVFLLSAIAALLGVFSTRLARVSDQVDRAAAELDTAGEPQAARLRARLVQLRRRSLALDAAGGLATLGGAATGCSILVLFVGSLRAWAAQTALTACFTTGVACTIGALVAFLTEMLMASRGVRVNVRRMGASGSGLARLLHLPAGDERDEN